MLIVIRAVNLVCSPDIHCCKGFALIILAGIKDQSLVRPFSERVGIDKTICPRIFEAGSHLRRLLQQRLHLCIRESKHPVAHPRDFGSPLAMPGALLPEQQVSWGNWPVTEAH